MTLLEEIVGAAIVAMLALAASILLTHIEQTSRHQRSVDAAASEWRSTMGRIDRFVRENGASQQGNVRVGSCSGGICRTLEIEGRPLADGDTPRLLLESRCVADGGRRSAPVIGGDGSCKPLPCGPGSRPVLLVSMEGRPARTFPADPRGGAVGARGASVCLSRPSPGEVMIKVAMEIPGATARIVQRDQSLSIPRRAPRAQRVP